MEGSDIPIALLGDGHHDKRSNGWDAACPADAQSAR